MLLQAADLLAGSIAASSHRINRENLSTHQEVELGGLIFPALMLDGISLANASAAQTGC
jgi:hypothetical protein